MSVDSVPTRVWDLPTRLFHWLLAGSVVGCVVTAKIGGDAMVWHNRLGHVVLALLVFRLLWGLVGGRWSRFTSLARAGSAVLRDWRGTLHPGERTDVGYSPTGAWSVLAMWLAVTAQVATGLVVDDEIAYVGPLNHLVSTDTGLAATSLHKTWGQWLILALGALHLLAIAFYAWRGNHLVRPMIVGDRVLPVGTPASADGMAQRTLALALALCAAGLAWWVYDLGH